MVQQRKNIQLALPFEERRLLNQGRFQVKWEPPYLVQPKLNGERCRAIVENGRCLLLSSTEELIQSVPHIQQACLWSLPDGEYDGELYRHGWTWAQIHSVVGRTTTLHPDHTEIELHIFDHPSNNAPQLIRTVELYTLMTSVPKLSPIKPVHSDVAYNLTELYSLYDRYIDEGYEGFIIREMNAPYCRTRTGAMMKFKPKATDTYEITGVYEAIAEDGTPKGMIGGFNCIDDMGTYFQVGAGKLNHIARREIWVEYLDNPYMFIGKMLEVEYQTMSDKNKVPLFSRAVRIL